MRRGEASTSAKARGGRRASAGSGEQPRATAIHNEDIALIFEEMTDLLELQDDNPFRIRAYRNGARVVRDLGREISAMVRSGEDLTALPGIGKDLAAKVREVIVTGECAALRALEADTPPALVALLKLPK